MISDVVYFQTKKEAENYARKVAGRVWRHCCKIEPVGGHRGGGWLVKMYPDIGSDKGVKRNAMGD